VAPTVPTTAAPVTTAPTKIPRTGSSADMTLVLGVGFLGLGLVMTGQGMELGAGGRLVRRRRWR
jgi:hypothetical protein